MPGSMRRDLLIAVVSAGLAAAAAVGVEELRFRNDQSAAGASVERQALLRAQDALAAVEAAEQPAFDDVYAGIDRGGAMVSPLTQHQEALSGAVGAAEAACAAVSDSRLRSACSAWVTDADKVNYGGLSDADSAQTLRLSVDDGYSVVRAKLSDALRSS